MNREQRHWEEYAAAKAAAPKMAAKLTAKEKGCRRRYAPSEGTAAAPRSSRRWASPPAPTAAGSATSYASWA